MLIKPTNIIGFGAMSMMAIKASIVEYPGTAVKRLNAIHRRLASLESLDGDWESVRRQLLYAGGLKDNSDPRLIGKGYTGHSFNDFNHCDLTPMTMETFDNLNDGAVKGIAIGNALGEGIRLASLPFDGEEESAGSWTTCMMNCNTEPPQDVAHVQFKSKIAFKLVWCPPSFETFVLVDDDGNLLKKGSPTGNLPPLDQRQLNYALVKGSKYAVAADREGQTPEKGLGEENQSSREL